MHETYSIKTYKKFRPKDELLDKFKEDAEEQSLKLSNHGQQMSVPRDCSSSRTRPAGSKYSVEKELKMRDYLFEKHAGTFNLREKRKELMKYIKKAFPDSVSNGCFDSIFFEVMKQDKEFIRLVNELSVKSEEYYNMKTKKHYLVIAREDLDELAGEKLR